FFVGLSFLSRFEADHPTLSSLRKQGSILGHFANFSSEKQRGDLFGRPRKQGSRKDGNGERKGVVDFVNLFSGIGMTTFRGDDKGGRDDKVGNVFSRNAIAFVIGWAVWDFVVLKENCIGCLLYWFWPR
ncbi:MAG: hypothetical protein AAF471_08360, partial [Myxococcota bacterium]